MDLDAFVVAHQAEWRRMHHLARTPKRRLSADEIDELLALYHRTSTHLSIVRSRSADPALVAWLSRLVLTARTALTPAIGPGRAGVVRFLTTTFPGEVYRARHWWVGVAVAFSLLSAIRMAVVAGDPHRFASQAEIDQLVTGGFEAYYSTFAPQNFAMLVWFNNAWLAAVCLAAGVLVLPVLLMLWINVENIGMVGGVMFGSGRGDIFVGLVLIHGLLELTAVFIAAGVGLRIGWAWIAPGSDRTRRQALAGRARAGMAVALGLAGVLLVSGLIEAFVTPAAAPVPVKLGIGATAWLVFLAYVFGYGAAAGGASSDVDPRYRPATTPTA